MAGRTETAMIIINVLVVDDHKIVRDVARKLLESDPGVRVVGEACDGVEAIDLTSNLQPDVIVMDISMPKMNGLEATSAIRARWPTISVILVTALAVDAYWEISQLCGATAFLAKENMPAQLLNTLHRVLRVA
jgi:two-component system, NarL family, response regulator